MKKLKLEELNRPDLTTFLNTDKIPVVLICDNLRSMYNVGSIFRTSDAFSIEKIYLCGITATPPHKEIRKTALGATESVSWEYVKNAKDLLKDLIQQDYIPLAIEQVENSVKLENFLIETNKKYALILGNEVEGVQQELIDLCQTAIEIPQSGTKHSLNVSVCAGIVVWEFYKNLMAKGLE